MPRPLVPSLLRRDVELQERVHIVDCDLGACSSKDYRTLQADWIAITKWPPPASVACSAENHSLADVREARQG